MGNERSDRRHDAREQAALSPSIAPLVRAGPDGLLAGATNVTEQRALVTRLQRSAGNASVVRLLRALAPADEADAPGQATGTLIVEDDAEPEPEQIRKSALLDQLEAAVKATAQAALGPMFVVTGCPWIEHWIAHYRGRSAADTAQAIRRYAPATAAATSAAELVPAITARVASGIESWQEDGTLPEQPPDGPGPPPQAAPAPQATGEDEDVEPVAFKLREDAPVERVQPRVVLRRLGRGRPLETSVSDRLGRAMGADFSSVRVHDSPGAGELASSLHARALTVGGHVAFAPNEYAPGTPIGDALLAHELAHVVQQGAAPASPAVARTASLEDDADEAAIAAVTDLHGGGVRRRSGAALRSGLRLQACAGPQHQDTMPRTGTTPAGLAIAGPQYQSSGGVHAENPGSPDARRIVQAMRGAGPTGPRAVAAVRDILSTYYPNEVAKVADVVPDASDAMLEVSPVGHGPETRGTIHVRGDFVTTDGGEFNAHYFAQRVLRVGHELMHINQYRAGMTAREQCHEREFLAHRWAALAPEATGTGRMDFGQRITRVDGAVRYYNGMDETLRRQYRPQLDELLARRREWYGRLHDPSHYSEAPPTDVSDCGHEGD